MTCFATVFTSPDSPAFVAAKEAQGVTRVSSTAALAVPPELVVLVDGPITGEVIDGAIVSLREHGEPRCFVAERSGAGARILLMLHEHDKATALPDPVEALVLDFDGVLTDNRVVVRDDGHESVLANRGDGMGLGLLAKAGVKLFILSKERNPVVARRAEKLKIECQHAVDDKPAVLKKWLADNDVRIENTIFVGNDVNDVGCMELVGCGACPSDSHPSAAAVADIVLDLPGGHGAVRELCDLILEGRR